MMIHTEEAKGSNFGLQGDRFLKVDYIMSQNKLSLVLHTDMDGEHHIMVYPSLKPFAKEFFHPAAMHTHQLHDQCSMDPVYSSLSFWWYTGTTQIRQPEVVRYKIYIKRWNDVSWMEQILCYNKLTDHG
jgi:hypothetical protein